MTELNLGTSPANAATPRKAMSTVRILIYVGLLLFVLIAIPVTRFLLWARCFDLRGFRFSGSSMCPTICEGEFVLAGMDAHNKRGPQRGEVILFFHDKANVTYIKRVIGVAGDTVGRGPANTILVNGAPLMPPQPCGEHNSYAPLAAEGPPFETVRVPTGSVFVIGDSLDNSYDSRFFGVVGVNKVRGKALLIYGSSSTSRIGCEIH